MNVSGANLRAKLKARFPFMVPWWRPILYFNLHGKSSERIFKDIYRLNKWSDEESRSGYGSNTSQTAAIRAALPLLLDEIKCGSLLDIPCGDFNWMSRIQLNADYIGADIVDELIEKNSRVYQCEGRSFEKLDLISDPLPRVDVVLCRDCLVHFSLPDSLKAISNIKRSGASYLLATTFIGRKTNEYIPTGGWRPINLEKPPFDLPPPVRLIDERCPMRDYADKRLGLWRVADLPDFE